MEEAITPGQPQTEGAATPEVAPAKGGEAVPEATTSSTTSATVVPEGSAVPEDEVAKLKVEVEQAKRLQGQADRKARRERLARKKLEKRIKTGETSPDEPGEETPPDDEDFQEVERAKAESQMTRLAFSDEKYRKALEADPTLRRITESNPLALVKSPIDAEDAVLQLQDILENRVDELSQTPEPTEEPKPPTEKETTPEETPPGSGAGVNPQGTPPAGYEDNLKKGNIDEAVAGKLNDPAAWNKPSA